MRSFLLIVKGSPDEALAAATARGLRAVVIGPTVHNSYHTSYLRGAPDDDWSTYAAWFAETRSPPFPTGSLLWYAPSSTPMEGAQ